MGFRRLAPLILGQAALFGCGVWAVIALHHAFYANLLLSLLTGAWIAAATLALALDVPRPRARLASAAAARERGSSRWRALVDQSPAPMVARPPDGALRAVNRAARAMFQTDDRIIDPPADLRLGMETPGGDDRRTLVLPTPSGGRVFALAVTDLDDGDEVTRLGVLTDIQSEIHFAEAKALRELLTVLNHEIMNSLTPVASLAETAADYLAEETSPAAKSAREALAVLSRRAHGLARFVEGYRALARLPPPTPRAIELGGLLGDVAEIFRANWQRRGVTLRFTPPSQAVARDLDPDLITQALLNLLTNAAEAAHGHAATPEVELTLLAEDGRLELVVADNGPGVAAQQRSEVFLPFVTTKPGGAGVGLSLARQIALSHGGDLVLAPSTRGARFRLVL